MCHRRLNVQNLIFHPFYSCYIYDRVSGSCPDLHSAAFDKDSVTQQLLKQLLHLFIQQAKGSHLCHYSESRYKDAPAEVIPVSNSFIHIHTYLCSVYLSLHRRASPKQRDDSKQRPSPDLRPCLQPERNNPAKCIKTKYLFIYLFISKLVVQHSSRAFFLN